jgi:hypothetical protein
MKYQTNLGESLCLIGSAEELGSWKDFSKARMKWTEGHIWVLENVALTKPNFQYKYVLMSGDHPSTWERGENRLADLTLLPNLSVNDSYLGQDSKTGTKNVEIVDTW